MDAERLLVILLAATLIVFLLLSIIFIINLIQISRRVNNLTEKMDDAATNVVSASEALRKIATPLAVSGALGKIAERFWKTKHKERGEKDD